MSCAPSREDSPMIHILINCLCRKEGDSATIGCKDDAMCIVRRVFFQRQSERFHLNMHDQGRLKKTALIHTNAFPTIVLQQRGHKGPKQKNNTVLATFVPYPFIDYAHTLHALSVTYCTYSPTTCHHHIFCVVDERHPQATDGKITWGGERRETAGGGSGAVNK